MLEATGSSFGSSLFCLFCTAAATMVVLKSFTSEIALRREAPKRNSLTFQKGFWKRSAMAPEAKSKAFENGREAGMSICGRRFVVQPLNPLQHI